MTEIKKLVIVQDPVNYDPIVITTTNGSTWSIDVAVTFRLLDPVVATTETDDVDLMLNIKSDAAIVNSFLGKNDSELVNDIHTRVAASDIEQRMNDLVKQFGYAVDRVDIQSFHKIRCLKHQGIELQGTPKE